MSRTSPQGATSRCRVLVVDDHPLFRKGAAQLVSLEDEFELVGEASTASRGLELAGELAPDLILLDLNLKDMSGLDVLRQLRADGVESCVVILTVSDAEDDLLCALRGGADGYLLKDMEPEEILVKLRHAAAGQVVLDDAVTALLANTIREESPAPEPGEVTLTEREEEILQLIAAGKSNKVIARELGISDGTVKVHVKNLLRKLNLRSRLEAAVWAIDRDANRHA